MKTIKPSKERQTAVDRETRAAVEDIIEKVIEQGDQALRFYSEKFDGSTRESFLVSQEEIDLAYEKITAEELSDIKEAAKNIKAFAEAQRETIGELKDFAPMEGVTLGHKIIPVDSALCYVPGGNYPLYSTALMLVIPAKVAGVKRVCAASPTEKGSGEIDDRTLVAMSVAGADEIYALGGAQAIGAFAYGTESIKPVDMIVGPGNQFVAEAKRQCYGQVGIDFVAGPSEVMVLADGTGDAKTVAADLLAQSEHAPNAKGILITLDEDFGQAVAKAVDEELKTLDTADIARISWESQGEILLAESWEEAIDYANGYAPEHLEINVKSDVLAEELASRLKNYGSLFMGENAAEVFGDYSSGTNHTLPTARAARYTGGLFVGTFLKTCTYQKMTEDGAIKLSSLTERLAQGEGLAAHALAAKKRRKK